MANINGDGNDDEGNGNNDGNEGDGNEHAGEHALEASARRGDDDGDNGLRPGEVTGTGEREATHEDAGGEEGEEGRQPVRARAPHQVSHEERDVHELTHTPYRAWCRHCVRARGRNTPHRAGEHEHKSTGVPKISMDYFFMSKADEQARANPLIVMVDEDTWEKYARAVGHKGIGKDNEMEWLIKDLAL